MKTKTSFSFWAVILSAAFLIFSGWQCPQKPDTGRADLKNFSSGDELVQAFQKTADEKSSGADRLSESSGLTVPQAVPGTSSVNGRGGAEYSMTNVQVAGVDEADIVKTDGRYIYTVAQGNLNIAEAYPADKMSLLSTVKLGDYQPDEIFVEGNRLLAFGTESVRTDSRSNMEISRRYSSLFSVRIFDIADRTAPRFIQRHDFEGTYITARKIGGDVYFVFNTYPAFRPGILCDELLPGYKENRQDVTPSGVDFQPIVPCENVVYVEPLRAENFITVASLSLADDRRPVEKEVIVGTGQNVYASADNLYVAQTNHPSYWWGLSYDSEDEKTTVSKFKLNSGRVEFSANGEVPGHILNQFSMDEFAGHFRIATTVGHAWSQTEKSKNNVYVLNGAMRRAGSLEDLAPGESIYSVRFMGERGYLVTFKKVDPLFVVDLSDHGNPRVLGKLKIPGYSDYLHPYDSTHIIGVGKETEEADESEKSQRKLDFAWYQGLKMAVFDISDVANPKEMHKVVIGDRGTDSPVLSDHKAFLFDRSKNLLVIPISLAEIKGERSPLNQYGETVYQGAYVYDLTLDKGFNLRGRITHVMDEDSFLKSGYYYSNEAICRSLYIDNVLYTFSSARLKANRLDNLEEVREVNFPEDDSPNNRRDYYY